MAWCLVKHRDKFTFYLYCFISSNIIHGVFEFFRSFHNMAPTLQDQQELGNDVPHCIILDIHGAKALS